MKISLNTIRQYTSVDLTVDELVSKINAQLGGVEEITDFSERYKEAVIVKINECDKHPNADKLNVCLIDDMGVVDTVPRNDDGLVQVVCGAPNVRAGMFVVWLPPASTVPSTANDAEPFVLGARELRGVLSQGMLASPKELGLGDSHDGILELDPDEWKPRGAVVEPGASFAKAYGLDDTIIDIENKMFTHRPDLFGHLGIAREIAGIQHNAFTSPDWYKTPINFMQGQGLELTVRNDASEKAPRFMAVCIKGVVVKPSPVWLQAALVAMGSKPINNIVDVTNYVMLLTAQPTHAYDYAKLRGSVLGVRTAKQGESITLLNHKTYKLDESDVVIVDGEGPVGLAGIMGGGDSEVSTSTTDIVLEVANFDMYSIRRSGMRHGIFTEASTRFTKGQSALQNEYVLSLLIQSVFDVAGGNIASEVFDVKAGSVDDAKPVVVTTHFVNERLGLDLTQEAMTELLTNVEMRVSGEDGHSHPNPGEKDYPVLIVQPPFWRTDIELPEDIVEEVGRLYGFDALPRSLPERSISPAPLNVPRAKKKHIRERLLNAGANEVLTYSFVHEKILVNAGQDPGHAFRLSNALSPDLQYYRLSILPSLLDKVHMNIKAGYDAFSLYEIGKTHFVGKMDSSDPGIPNEGTQLALVIAYAEKRQPEGAAYYHALRYLRQISDMDAESLVPLTEADTASDESARQLTAAYDPDRSAVVIKDNQIRGVVGEFSDRTRKAFKLPRFAAGFELHLDSVSVPEPVYTPLSRYPSISQDVSLIVNAATTYESVLKSAKRGIDAQTGALSVALSPVSIYQAEGSDDKTITLGLKITSHEKTLRDDDVKPLVDAIVDSAKNDVGARTI